MEQKSKSPLTLMEQAIMLLIFAFATAIAILAFAKAEQLSKNLELKDHAVNVSQTVAETVKATDGNLLRVAELLEGTATEQELLVYYNENWETVQKTEAVYELVLVCTERSPYMTKSEITVNAVKDRKVLFCLPLAWQEVAHE